ncbi:MAG: beta-galactosidase [Candidatus Sericytochromatia bacterium]|nr:beta-galactosidase [Candidatus Sericytochromatia bacterium]
MTIAFRERRIHVHGRPDLLLGGEFQYFRIPRQLWRPSLETLKDAGLGVVSAYVPWVWHEPEPGVLDFSGTTAPERDLVGFMALCEELGLPLVVKPGPFIFAEYQGFGIPLWLQTEHPEILMVVRRPQAYPQPALNHPGYLALVRGWFDAVARVVRPFAQRGVVFALQIDNETGYPQFGQGPHLTDRNPETLVLLRTVLAEHHGTIEALNAEWGTDFASFDVVEPPDERLFNEQQADAMARWVEDYVVRYLQALRGMWEAIDLGLPLFLNDIWLDSWPSHLGKKNQVAPLAYDIYPRYSHLPVTFDQPYSISYVPKLFDAFLEDGPLMCAEMGAGWLDPACEVKPAATFQSTMAAFAHGTQASFFYILMDGRDSDGDYVFRSFLDQRGQPLERLATLRRLAGFVRRWGQALAATQDPPSDLAILHSPAVTPDMLAAAVNPGGAVARGSQRPIDEAVTLVSVNAGLFGALAEAGFAPEVQNLEKVTPQALARYKAVFFNSIGWLEPGLQRKLEQYVASGGTLITLGTPFSEGGTLLPGRVRGVSNPSSWWVMWRTAWDLVRVHWRTRTGGIGHRFCAFTVLGMQPAMLLNRYATRAGRMLEGTGGLGALWASRLVTWCEAGPRFGTRSLLRQGRRSAGYEVGYGHGRSIFIGTLLGAAFDSPGYYLDDPGRKASVTGFLGTLLERVGVASAHTPVANLEVVVREGERHRFAFVFNRGSARDFSLTLHVPVEGWRFSDAWAEGETRGEAIGARLEGHLAADDVLVFVWEREGP